MKKTLENVKDDMAALYEELKNKRIERVDAAELANIAGKWIKAEGLRLANDMFLDELQMRVAKPLPTVREALEHRPRRISKRRAA